MEQASVLHVLSPCRVVVSLSSGAVVCAALDSAVDGDVGRASPSDPVHGWVRLGAYNLNERTFEGSSFYPDRTVYEPVTTVYSRVLPLTW